ncbi:MAG: hydrogenase expression/formation protein HypE [Deltaproteobacteria bacterium]|nr:hydrogenase expression/formation protein HypE [Deltaproteobacteria bacterium]
MDNKSDLPSDCPLPIADASQVLLAHGGGGKLMHQLIETEFISALDNPLLGTRHDGAIISLGSHRIAFTTDSYVVRPLFFPGGDIGTLAVNGTVNDLAMCAARPRFLSLGLVLEEGFSMDSLRRITRSIQQASSSAGVQVVTGDTKVVERGKGDGVYINTAGIGMIETALNVGPRFIRPGDAILLSGDVGRHGIAVMAQREGLEFESHIQSDCAAVSGVVMRLIDAGIEVHCLRDLTRGGLASAMVEIAETAGLQINLVESCIPVHDEVHGACEMLGLDPLYVANEGRFAAFVAERDADRALSLMRAAPEGPGSAVIGKVTAETNGQVILKSRIGTERIIQLLSGEQLPRIC